MKKKNDSLHFCNDNMKCSGNASFLHNTYFTQQRARLLLYFRVILTLHEYLHFYYKLSLIIRQRLA